jgi:hypothetical protein
MKSEIASMPNRSSRNCRLLGRKTDAGRSRFFRPASLDDSVSAETLVGIAAAQDAFESNDAAIASVINEGS